MNISRMWWNENMLVCWVPVCWVPVCWVPVCWVPVCQLFLCANLPPATLLTVSCYHVCVLPYTGVCVCAHACVCACVCVCMRACVHVWVRACVSVLVRSSDPPLRTVFLILEWSVIDFFCVCVLMTSFNAIERSPGFSQFPTLANSRCN